MSAGVAAGEVGIDSCRRHSVPLLPPLKMHTSPLPKLVTCIHAPTRLTLCKVNAAKPAHMCTVKWEFQSLNAIEELCSIS